MTIAERTARNLNAHAAATFAMWHWHDRYAAQGGGVMDFWDSLTRREKVYCCDAVDAISEARRREA